MQKIIHFLKESEFSSYLQLMRLNIFADTGNSLLVIIIISKKLFRTVFN